MAHLYNDVVTVTDKYFGPPADRFVARQMRSLLQRDPVNLQPEDLQHLLDWIELSMRLISTDRQAVNHYMHDLTALAQQSKSHRANGKKVRA